MVVVSYVSLNGAFLKNEEAFNIQEGLMTDAIELQYRCNCVHPPFLEIKPHNVQ